MFKKTINGHAKKELKKHFAGKYDQASKIPAGCWTRWQNSHGERAWLLPGKGKR